MLNEHATVDEILTVARRSVEIVKANLDKLRSKSAPGEIGQAFIRADVMADGLGSALANLNTVLTDPPDETAPDRLESALENLMTVLTDPPDETAPEDMADALERVAVMVLAVREMPRPQGAIALARAQQLLAHAQISFLEPSEEPPEAPVSTESESTDSDS